MLIWLLLRAPRILASIHTWRRNYDFTQDYCRGALLSVMAATPIFAQAAIQEPGLFAF
jgi:hypothetical protein